MHKTKDMIINILGTKWKIEYRSPADDGLLHDRYGYCDYSIKLIVIRTEQLEDELLNYSHVRKSALRHELIHAFMYESGLNDNVAHPEFGIDETMVDWIAIQFPKLIEVFEKVGCL